jgi:hypothetical protein
MYVVGHHDCGLQFGALSVFIEAVLQHKIASSFGEGIQCQLAERHKNDRIGFLIVG